MTDKETRVVISMPLSYWEINLGYWKIPPAYLEEAKKRKDGIIGKIKNGDYLVIGDESNKR
jgi:hypothetical protein